MSVLSKPLRAVVKRENAFYRIGKHSRTQDACLFFCLEVEGENKRKVFEHGGGGATSD